MDEICAFVKEQAGTTYMDLYGRRIVDVAIDLICGCLFLQDAAIDEGRQTRAQRWITTRLPRIRYAQELIQSGDTSTMSDFDALAGLPAEEE